ncbi:MAG: peptidylprolyl isomerase [Zoogloeaceae bacterium]|jgi:peptidyl-prolyl cis-trans isomerase C|nr:peptidylprolyl isomerase [Zoogloeaceae bacterium]
MRKLTRLSAAFLAFSLFTLPAGAQDAASGGLSKEAEEVFIQEQLDRGAQDTPEFRESVKKVLQRRALIANEARKQGLDKSKDVTTRIAFATQDILINAFISDYLKKNPATEAEVKKAYESVLGQLQGQEYKARHILVEQESEAKGIITKLNGGGKFADLAKASKDPGSREKGGDLGWNQASAYVEPFGTELAKLKKGQYTKTPVKTQFGYHVILLEDSRKLTPPTLEQLKPQLEKRVEGEKVEKLVSSLENTAK